VTDTGPLREELESPSEIAAQIAPAARAPFADPVRLAKAKELVRALAVSHTNAGLYPTSHPLVEQSLTELVSAVDDLRAAGFRDVTVNVYKGTLFVENQVFPEESVTYRRMIEELLGSGISALTFLESFSTTDAAVLAEVISDTRSQTSKPRASCSSAAPRPASISPKPPHSRTQVTRRRAARTRRAPGTAVTQGSTRCAMWRPRPSSARSSESSHFRMS
jgi:hypothetical protein